ncbi:hypothetical protein Micbo1qcDRAFT_221223 [Microdochium bolleyi]|uniref:GPI anchored protein n=1 Tax=Microdochium bolleyi TaxID=196109 RepID=A0A136JC51_9PEZI|nr:hypothetical protein Micbo1qcDRAFT_221223 [Microdochium bolleyi]
MQLFKSILVLAFALMGMAAPADVFDLEARQETDCACSGTVTVTVPAGSIPPTILDTSTLLIATPVPTIATDPAVTPSGYGTDSAIQITPTPTDPAVTTDPASTTPVPGTDATASEPAATSLVTNPAVSSELTPVESSSSVLESYTSSAGEIASSATDAIETTPTESIAQGGAAAPTGAFGLGAMLGGAAVIAMAL